MRPTNSTPILVLLALAAACDTTDAGDDGATQAEPRVTYYDDVLPILAIKCQGCHEQGGVAPFAVDTYDEAKAWGAAMASSAAARTMPPFAADNSGDCNTFVDAQWLSGDEIQTLQHWVDADMLEGNPEAQRTPVPDPNTLHDVSAARTIHGPAGYTPVGESYPGGEFEDYQCFLADYDADTDRFVTGFDVTPGNLATVHHVLVMEVDPDFGTNGATIAKLDAESPDQVGWSCFGAAGDGVLPEGVPVAWAPGTGAVNYPAGTGIRIEAGHQLVIQMHYNLANDDGPDTTEIQLGMADSVEREGLQTLVDPFLFSSIAGQPASLPPGEERTEYKWAMPIEAALSLDYDEDDDRQLDVYGILPHMHGRGVDMKVSFDVGGAEQCGAKIDRWDFNWQRMYFYDQPMPMRFGDTLKVTCGFNTMGDVEPVMPGFGTADEMCLLGLYVVPR